MVFLRSWYQFWVLFCLGVVWSSVVYIGCSYIAEQQFSAPRVWSMWCRTLREFNVLLPVWFRSGSATVSATVVLRQGQTVALRQPWCLSEVAPWSARLSCRWSHQPCRLLHGQCTARLYKVSVHNCLAGLCCQSSSLSFNNFAFKGSWGNKKNPKFREKFGSGWVGPRPTRIKNFFWKSKTVCATNDLPLFPLGAPPGECSRTKMEIFAMSHDCATSVLNMICLWYVVFCCIYLLGIYSNFFSIGGGWVGSILSHFFGLLEFYETQRNVSTGAVSMQAGHS